MWIELSKDKVLINLAKITDIRLNKEAKSVLLYQENGECNIIKHDTMSEAVEMYNRLKKLLIEEGEE